MASFEPVADGGMRIFLSYSRKDAAFTRWLAEALSRHGYTVDFDQAAADLTDRNPPVTVRRHVALGKSAAADCRQRRLAQSRFF